ncbi:MAG: carbohydrate-binding domain-containing protein [Clostridiales Family XIII bacterium]|jgi:hypothetical protein|nr:carbohydrate-binding domain-containing protein [Clostridiales Family XIII bacterium]
MKWKRDAGIAFAIAAGLLFSAGCGATDASPEPEGGGAASAAVAAVAAYVSYEFSDEDTDSSFSGQGASTIAFDGDRATINGAGVSSAGGVVTVSSAGTYVFSGETDDGQIVVYVGKNDVVRLVLDNLSIACPDGPPIYSMRAGKTVVVLAEGSHNTVRDAASYTQTDEDGEPDAAIFSKDSLTITGAGALSVEASRLDGICSKDVLAITGGTIDVRAVDDGLRGTDGVAISDGALTVRAGGQGIKSTKYEEDENGELTEGFLLIQGGAIDIPECFEGLEAPRIQIDGGDIDIAASDDGINGAGSAADGGTAGAGTAGQIPGTRPGGQEWDKARPGGEAAQGAGGAPGRPGMDAGDVPDRAVMDAGDVPGVEAGDVPDRAVMDAGDVPGVDAGGAPPAQAMNPAQGMAGGGGFGEMAQSGVFLRVTGGTLDVSGGKDGIDINGDIYIGGGKIMISGQSQGMEGAIDLDGTLVITGGDLITAGSVTAPGAASAQNTLVFSYSGQHTAMSLIELKDGSGEALLAYESRIGFSVSAFSSPGLKDGETYAVCIDGEKLADVTLSGATTSIAQDGGGYAAGGAAGGSGRGGGGWGGAPAAGRLLPEAGGIADAA